MELTEVARTRSKMDLGLTLLYLETEVASLPRGE